MHFKKQHVFLTSCLVMVLFILPSRLMAQMNVQFADTLNKTLANLKQAYKMNGVASAVVFPDGSTWSSAAGYYGTQSLHTDLLYDIGSNTKSMIAAIILLMEEENKLSIDDTLYTFINPIKHVPYGVTLKQLMNHRSGIFSYTDHPDFLTEINTNESKFWHTDSVLLRFLAPPNFPVGSSWSYSNTNYFLLGKVIEMVDSKPLHAVLKDRLFMPNHMNNTYLDQYDVYTKTKLGAWFGSSTYYDTDFVAFMSCAWAAGAVIATPDDFAFWAHQLFSGQVLNTTSMAKMRVGTQVNKKLTYGLGIFEEDYRGRSYLMHGGTTLQNSEMHYSLDTKFTVALMNIDANFTNETANLQHDLIDLLEALIPSYVGIEESRGQFSIEAYPNPSNTFITLNIPPERRTTYTSVNVYDSMGQLVFQEDLKSEQLTLKKSNFGEGMFFVRIFNGSLLMSSKKILFN
jgi:D-alanyl-D-alanine carboxypeptidase